jgi:hypothetical protein
LGALGGNRVASTHDHQIQPQKPQPVPAKALPHQALEAVAVHRTPGALLGNSQPQPALLVGIRPSQDGKVTIDGLTGVFEDPLELCLVEEPGGAGKALVASKPSGLFPWLPRDACAGLLAGPSLGRIAGAEVAGQRGVSRTRPLARRACKTFRPLRVALRARKPWVLARLRRLG